MHPKSPCPKRQNVAKKNVHFSRATQRASIIEARKNFVSSFREMFAEGPRLPDDARDTPGQALCQCFRLGMRNEDCSRQVRAWDARRRLACSYFVEGDHSGGIHAAPFQHHGADLSHPRIQEHLTLSPNQANRRTRVTAHRIAGAAPHPN